MSFEETVKQHLRLTILRLLVDDRNYMMNDSMITDMTKEWGFSPSRDRVRTELSWLREQGLVRYEDDKNIIIAELTQRGADVATGSAAVPGVKRPSPKF